MDNNQNDLFTYNMCKAIRTRLLKAVGQIIADHRWDALHAGNLLLQAVDPILDLRANWNFASICLADLTEEQAKELGFVSEDNIVYIIPTWLFPFLPDTLDCATPEGIPTTIQTREVDLVNNRFGMVLRRNNF